MKQFIAVYEGFEAGRYVFKLTKDDSIHKLFASEITDIFSEVELANKMADYVGMKFLLGFYYSPVGYYVRSYVSYGKTTYRVYNAYNHQVTETKYASIQSIPDRIGDERVYKYEKTIMLRRLHEAG